MSRELWIALIALIGVMVGQGVLIWKSLADRADRKREELWRNVRWAVEKATESEQPAANDVGLAMLDELDNDPRLSKEDQRLISAVVASALVNVDLTYSGVTVDEIDLVEPETKREVSDGADRNLTRGDAAQS